MKDYSTIPNTTGSFPAVESQNASGPGETDGTPYFKQVIDDMWGARQALMLKAELTPSGNQETATLSQLLEAIQIIARQDPLWASNWEAQSPSAATNISKLAYGAGLFVLVTGNNQIETSPDGETWTVRTSAMSQPINTVFFANSLFIAAGNNGEIQTSPDGITWTLRTPAGGYTGAWRGGAYGAGLFVLVGSGPQIQTSPDGITWTSRSPAGASNFFACTFGGSLFCAVGASGTIETSPDGITWTARTAAGSSNFFGVTYGYGKFVAVGVSSTIETSPDGVTWTAQTSSGAIDFDDVIYENGIYMAVGDGTGTNNDSMEYSVDGITWKGVFLSSLSFNGIAYGNRRAVIGGGSLVRTSLYHG